MSKLCNEALLAGIPALAQRHRHGEIDDASYAALYFLYWQIATHGPRCASRRFKLDPRPDPALWLSHTEHAHGAELKSVLRNYLDRYQFTGVIPNVCTALIAWLDGEWPLMLLEHIPKSVDVLHMQLQGMRPVTIIAEHPRLMRPVLRKPNAFDFMLHDLEHAYKFFHDPLLHAGQRAFFQRIAHSIEQGRFNSYLNDSWFVEKFDYLISDMNTHWMHSLQYLRAILIEFHLRREQKHLRDALSHEAAAIISGLLLPFQAQLQHEAIAHAGNIAG